LVAAAAAAAAGAAPAPPIGTPNYTLDISDKLLTIVIQKFRGFLHNRVGTSLKEGEQANLIEYDNLVVGELVTVLGNMRWGIITKIDPAGTYTVYTVDEPSGIDNNIQAKLTFENYNNGQLRKSTVVVEQISKPNQKLSETDLETYDLNL
jgi:hypothetical protein